MNSIRETLLDRHENCSLRTLESPSPIAAHWIGVGSLLHVTYGEKRRQDEFTQPVKGYVLTRTDIDTTPHPRSRILAPTVIRTVETTEPTDFAAQSVPKILPSRIKDYVLYQDGGDLVEARQYSLFYPSLEGEEEIPAFEDLTKEVLTFETATMLSSFIGNAILDMELGRLHTNEALNVRVLPSIGLPLLEMEPIPAYPTIVRQPETNLPQPCDRML